MRKSFLLILVGIFGSAFVAHADVERASKLTPQQKQRIAWALKILKDTKTLVESEKQCAQFDEDILSVLESEGYLEDGDVQPQTICIGPGDKTK